MLHYYDTFIVYFRSIIAFNAVDVSSYASCPSLWLKFSGASQSYESPPTLPPLVEVMARCAGSENSYLSESLAKPATFLPATGCCLLEFRRKGPILL